MTDGDWAAEAHRQRQRRRGKCGRRVVAMAVLFVTAVWLAVIVFNRSMR